MDSYFKGIKPVAIKQEAYHLPQEFKEIIYPISNEEFHVGNLIKLNFTIAEKKILIEVYIKRKEKFMQGLNLKKYGYGIEFSELGEEFNTIIRDYIYSIYKKFKYSYSSCYRKWNLFKLFK